jgi:hypothetical protein
MDAPWLIYSWTRSQVTSYSNGLALLQLNVVKRFILVCAYFVRSATSACLIASDWIESNRNAGQFVIKALTPTTVICNYNYSKKN